MQALDQALDILRLPASLDFHAVCIVAHPAAQFQLLGQAQSQRTQTNPLNDSGKADALTNKAMTIGF